MAQINLDFSGETAFVTGGASGIGFAVARNFVQAGASVVIADIDESAGLAAQRKLESSGGKARFLSIDVSSPDAVVATVAAAIDGLGALDYAVNCAGIVLTGSTVAETEFEQWRRLMSINLDGVFLCMREELKAMEPRGKGVIINIASGAGLIGVPMMAAYSSSKHAVIGLTRSAAMESMASGVRINAVCPAGVDTPMLDDILPTDEMRAGVSSQHLGNRFATPDEVASTVLFACSDGAGYSTGVEFKVNGGAVF